MKPSKPTTKPYTRRSESYKAEALKQTVFEYIETDYNRVRLHSANDYQSPVAFEAAIYQKLAS
ncbi:Integrase core domain-containing protein [Thiothrix eikelboomii]|uniref:Integrase core domain-containing protein n=1 Tax=Thiothrix eikelboomii TaxID=92487 RepID=A0A1T4VR27_9GAMM|nr:Integrase core domain-containing protein [Thiothrix eikelboomii]